ncbi:MAG: hypothetical protein AAF098_10630 [Pseudomonadota bacterium]
MIKHSISVPIVFGALALVAIPSSLGWAESKPKIDLRAKQIESVHSRLDALEERLGKLEKYFSSNTDGQLGSDFSSASLDARVTALEQQLRVQAGPATQ